MLSSDDPFEYFGSLSLAVRNLDGKSPKMLISNLRNASDGKMQDASKFLATELRTRQFHKRWIKEMQKEGYSGAVTMASQISNFWGWQVVDPNLVRDDQWQNFHEIYVNDKLKLNLNDWFEKVNPGAQAHLVERMLEAIRKDYWKASNQTQKELVERYVSLVDKYTLIVDNQKLKVFVNLKAVRFGLNPLTEKIESQTLPFNELKSTDQIELVKGLQLEKVDNKKVEPLWDKKLIWMLIFCGLVIVGGGIKQYRQTFRYKPLLNENF
jgi:cobaltochelatase CobN